MIEFLIKNYTAKIASKIVAILLPNRCLACNCFISEDQIFCADDLKKLHFIDQNKCQICSYQFKDHDHNSTPKICIKCQKNKPHFDFAAAVFTYNPLLSEVIHGLKYYDQTAHAKKLGKLVSEVIKQTKNISDYDFIAPIPVSKNRLKTRKFNQSALLALRVIKENRHLKFMPDLLIRQKFVKAQAHLSQQDRMRNIAGSFGLNKKYHGLIADKKILLIDDVMTTGATLNECAKILKNAKAKEVMVGVVAKTDFE